jgi:hypothetical protein
VWVGVWPRVPRSTGRGVVAGVCGLAFFGGGWAMRGLEPAGSQGKKLNPRVGLTARLEGQGRGCRGTEPCLLCLFSG